MTNCYFETLSETIVGIHAEIDERSAVLVTVDWPKAIYDAGHIAYDTQHNHDFAIASLKGKPTKKYFHVVICRLDSGRYELNTYVL